MKDKTVIIDENGVEIDVTNENKVEKNISHKISALTPLVSLLVFLFFGFFFNAWSVCWLAWLLIPVVEITISITKKRGRALIMSLLFLVCTALYIGLGIYLGRNTDINGVWWKLLLIYIFIPIVAVIID